MERFFPNCQTTVVLREMPFEEEVSSFGSYFDKATFSVKNENEKRKRVRRDLLTSVATTLRSIERQKPTLIVGDGAGARSSPLGTISGSTMGTRPTCWQIEAYLES